MENIFYLVCTLTRLHVPAGVAVFFLFELAHCVVELFLELAAFGSQVVDGFEEDVAGVCGSVCWGVGMRLDDVVVAAEQQQQYS